MRRIAGFALTLAGAGLLAYVSTSYARAYVARDRVRTEWEASLARNAVRDAYAITRVASLPSEPAPGRPVARLLIPAIGLDEVVVEGVEGAVLNAGPGHLPGSVLPGERGNSVLSAHRDRHFISLGRVQTGDTVVTETASGRTTWVVVSRRIVGRGKPALFGTADPTLTLTTCWPVQYLGPSPDRLIVTATPVRLDAAGISNRAAVLRSGFGIRRRTASREVAGM